jgi:hypothetical protein
MFADTEVKLPRGIQTRSPQDVARAVLEAIEHNRGEVDVAPLAVRASAVLGGVAPEIAATLGRRFGASELSSQIAARQLEKR